MCNMRQYDALVVGVGGHCPLGRVRCTVCTKSWGWHGPKPARWGANNGMHTGLYRDAHKLNSHSSFKLFSGNNFTA